MLGVFDSGVGGLSIHQALSQRLPDADILYLADQANTPYGAKTSAEILRLTQKGCEILFARGASLVILACNTAAAIALRPLQQGWLEDYRRDTRRCVNLLGIIVPTIEEATGQQWHAPAAAPSGAPVTLGIFATPATVRSDVYGIEIAKRRPDAQVVQEACPTLARLIETGASCASLREAITHHAAALAKRIGNKPWQAILGCTHYEIVADLFTEALPADTRLIHQPTATADALTRYLVRHPQYTLGNQGLRRFITTGAGEANALADAFRGNPTVFTSVSDRFLV